MEYEIWKGEDGDGAVTVVHEGQSYNATSSNPKFDEIVRGLLTDQDEGEVIGLFDLAAAVANHFEPLSERVSVHDGRIYFDQEEINDELTAHILRALDGSKRAGTDVTSYMPFVNFLEKIKTNPSQHSQEQLWSWLKDRAFTITLEGDIIAYKGVYTRDGEYVSSNEGFAIVNGEPIQGKIPNPIGGIVEMPRSSVVHDPRNGCSKGLHVATYPFAKSFASVCLAVIVNPRDVVSVPNESRADKMRVCRYVVKEVVHAPYVGTVLTDDEDSLQHPSKATGQFDYHGPNDNIDDDAADDCSQCGCVCGECDCQYGTYCEECGCGGAEAEEQELEAELRRDGGAESEAVAPWRAQDHEAGDTAPTTTANTQSPLDQEPTYKKLMGLLTNPGGSYKPFEVVDWLNRVCGVITTKDSLRRFKSRHGL